jgi:hypothetical protein
MDVDEQLEQLSRRLHWQSPAHIDTAVDEIMVRLRAAGSALVAGLRWAAHERPLITILLSCQLGYLVGRMGHRYARR